jgi:hypothetical protein
MSISMMEYKKQSFLECILGCFKSSNDDRREQIANHSHNNSIDIVHAQTRMHKTVNATANVSQEIITPIDFDWQQKEMAQFAKRLDWIDGELSTFNVKHKLLPLASVASITSDFAHVIHTRRGRQPIHDLSEYHDESASMDYMCGICLGICIEPMALPQCSHLYCKICLEGITVSRRYCPECQTPFELKLCIVNHNAAKYIRNLKLKCVQHKQGCQEIMITDDIKKHDQRCPFNLILCMECGRLLMRRFMDAHVNSLCVEHTSNEIVSFFDPNESITCKNQHDSTNRRTTPNQQLEQLNQRINMTNIAIVYWKDKLNDMESQFQANVNDINNRIVKTESLLRNLDKNKART